MEEIIQHSIYDVLRGILNDTSETYRAIVEESYETSSDIPPPDNIYVPPPLRTDIAADGIAISSPINFPYPPKPNWLERNWKWLTVVAIAVISIVVILYIRKKRKKKKDEEAFRQWEAEHLPTIDYPWPSAASGPVVISEPAATSLLVEYFDELERVERAQEPPKEAELPPKS